MTSRLKKAKDIKGIVEQEFKFNNYSYDEKTDCPIPYISCVCKDSPIPTKIDGPDAGVRMRCLNEDCQLAKMLVHKKCFEKLEENLLKILTKKGSARGWTDVQRRSNLWEKKGQGLVGNMLLCHCGHGMMCLDVDFYKEKELEEQRKQLLAEAKQRKKKCNKKSKLPAVNISNNGPVAPELLQNDFIPHGNKGLNRRQTSHSTSTFMFQSDESDTEYINEQRNSTPPLKSMLIVDKPKPLASDRPKSKPDLESTPKPLLPFLSRKDKIRGGGRKSLPAPKSLIETPILPPMINRSCGPIYLKGKGGDTPKHVVGQSPAAQKVVNEKAKSAGIGGGGQMIKTATPTTAQIVQKGPQQQSRKTSTIEKRPLGLVQTPSIPVPTSKPESGAFYSLFDPGARSFNLGELLLGESRLPGLITQPRLFSHLI